MTELAITFQDIVDAHARTAHAIWRTPVMTSATADARTGARLLLKCENFQRMGAFKMRGAYNAIAQFSPAQRKGGVIAYSSGNHAQAIALSARLLGVHAVIVMPNDAPTAKLAATREYGAEVVLYDRYTQDREALGRQLADERGATLIPPYDHPHVMAGQGTAAKELLEDVGDLDLFLAPVGGGGLMSGCAVAVRAMSPQCAIVGVEPAAGNDVQQSMQAGHVVRIATPQTIADGAQTQQVGALTFPVIQSLVREIVTVTDDELVATMQFLAQRMKVVVEPTGCLALAAVLHGKVEVSGKRIGLVLSGGNVDLAQYGAMLAQ